MDKPLEGFDIVGSSNMLRHVKRVEWVNISTYGTSRLWKNTLVAEVSCV